MGHVANAAPEEDSPLLRSSSSNSSGNTLQANQDDVEVGPSDQTISYTAIDETAMTRHHLAIDWLAEEIRGDARHIALRNEQGLRSRLYVTWDVCVGWIAAIITGVLTGLFAVAINDILDIAGKSKTGYCPENLLLSRDECKAWIDWSADWRLSFGAYLGVALLFAVVACLITTLARFAPNRRARSDDHPPPISRPLKVTYAAASSGVPEVRRYLSGEIIPRILDFDVLMIKFGASALAVASGLCIGKEGPLIHIGAAVGRLTSSFFDKFKNNGRKARSIVTVGFAAGTAAAFNAPIVGLVFAYEEAALHFSTKILWRAFLGCVCAGLTITALGPGPSPRVHYGACQNEEASVGDYFLIILIGALGGLWGGSVPLASGQWGPRFRSLSLIKFHPVFEVILLTIVTTSLQWPAPLVRQSGEQLLKEMLGTCAVPGNTDNNGSVSTAASIGIGALFYSLAVKVALIPVTLGSTIPFGVIIPAMDVGSLVGMLLAKLPFSSSTHMLVLVCSASFLTGLTRMTISTCVIFYELTGQSKYFLPVIVAVLISKALADHTARYGVHQASPNGVAYLQPDVKNALVNAQQQGRALTVMETITESSLHDNTLAIQDNGTVSTEDLESKLALLLEMHTMTNGLVFVSQSRAVGYSNGRQLETMLQRLEQGSHQRTAVQLVNYAMKATGRKGSPGLITLPEDHLDFRNYVGPAPLSLGSGAPLQVAVQALGKLGGKCLVVTHDSTGNILGVLTPERLRDALSLA